MWEHRAERARRDITALAATGLGVSELHAAAIALVDRQITTELTCWASIDPETLVISGMTSGEAGIPPEYEPLLAEAEYSAAEPHTFAALARQTHALARLSDLSHAERQRSARLNTVWRPLGLDSELRALFVVDGACWGGAGMVRRGSDFTDRETEFFAAVAPAIAAATRMAVRAEAHRPAPDGPPAIVLVDRHGQLCSVTAAAQDWKDRLDQIAPGRFMVMMQVMATGARSAASGSFRARLRDAHGNWAVLAASPLVGDDLDQVAVVIEPASGDQLLGMLLQAYSLTDRERQVCREVIGGRSTAEIGASLFISAHTVQDHLKSVFAKVGVRSRGALVARLRPEEATGGDADAGAEDES